MTMTNDKVTLRSFQYRAKWGDMGVKILYNIYYIYYIIF